WLSVVRNNINYKHQMGAWFPYERTERNYPDAYHQLCSDWNEPSLTIPLKSRSGSDGHRFLRTCIFIVSLVREVITDMASRNPERRSFHKYGSLALFGLLHQP